MPDPARLAHTAGRDNHLRLYVLIDRPGIIGGYRGSQPRKSNGIHSLLQKLHGLLVKITPHMLTENIRGFNGQRAVHPHFKIVVPGHQILFLNPPYKIKHLLGPSYGKRGNHHISSPVKGSLKHLGQGHGIIRRFLMASVPIGTLHHHIIRLCQILGIPDQRLVGVPDIPGEHNLLLNPLFPDPDLNGRRSQKMSRICKADPYALCHDNLFIIRTADKTGKGPLCVLHVIKGQNLFLSCSLAFSVFPLSFKDLNVGAVPKHNLTQIRCGGGGKNLSPEPLFIQKGKLP